MAGFGTAVAAGTGHRTAAGHRSMERPRSAVCTGIGSFGPAALEAEVSGDAASLLGLAGMGIPPVAELDSSGFDTDFGNCYLYFVKDSLAAETDFD